MTPRGRENPPPVKGSGTTSTLCPHTSQRLDRLRINPVVDKGLALGGIYTRRRDRLLHAHPKVDHVRDHVRHSTHDSCARPGAPTVRKGWPSLSSSNGVMLFNARLNPAIEFAAPGMGLKTVMPLLSSTPVPGTTTPEPNCATGRLRAGYHVPVSVDDAEVGRAVARARGRRGGDCALRPRLRVVTPGVVQGTVRVGNPWAAPRGSSSSFAVSLSMESAISRAYSFDRIPSIGTGTKFRSPT